MENISTFDEFYVIYCLYQEYYGVTLIHWCIITCQNIKGMISELVKED